MELERRFVFYGNAAPVSGQIYDPDHAIVDAGGASSLTVAGGASHGSLKETAFGKFVRIGAAATSARGVFDDRERARLLTHHQVPADTVPSTTTVKGEVTEIVVGIDPHPILRVKRLAASLVGRSPRGSGEPSIRPRDLDISGVRIGDFELDVAVSDDFLTDNDTYSKLLVAADQESFAADYGSRFRMTSPAGEAASMARGRYGNAVYGSVVRRIEWRHGKEFPGSKIDGHSVRIPDFGLIFFGEIFITSQSRRLTMLRLELGSPIGALVAFDEVQTNGGWYP
jgi:hypothetical protein